MKMQCARITQILNEADFTTGPALQLDETAQAHLNACPACRKEYHAYREARQLFAAVRPVEPDPSFGSAWREKLREVCLPEQAGIEVNASLNNNVKLDLATRKPRRFVFRLPQFPAWQWAAGLGAAVFILIVAFGLKGPARLSSGFNQGITRAAGGSSAIAARDGARYQLQIIKIGPQKKLVQRIIQDYHRSAEGGASYAFRDPEASLSFHTLTLQQARTFKRDLEKAGAVVDIGQEK